jgi:hypothetical protein
MSHFASSLKMPFALMVAAFLVWAAAARLQGRSHAAIPGPAVLAPEPGSREGEPASNEIADFQQLD